MNKQKIEKKIEDMSKAGKRICSLDILDKLNISYENVLKILKKFEEKG